MTGRCCSVGAEEAAGAPATLDPRTSSAGSYPPVRGSSCGSGDSCAGREAPDAATDDPGEVVGAALDDEGAGLRRAAAWDSTDLEVDSVLHCVSSAGDQLRCPRCLLQAGT